MTASKDSSQKTSGIQQLIQALDNVRGRVLREPTNVSLRVDFAKMLLDLKFYKDASVQARVATQLAPHHPEACHHLGFALLAQGENTECLEWLLKAYAGMPDNRKLLAHLGKAHVALGKTTDGEVFCRRALALEPNDVYTLTNLGMAVRYQGRYQEALECFQKAIQIDPSYSTAQYDMGLTQLLLGNYEAGWRGFNYRLKSERFLTRDNFSRPMWDGKPFAGKKLLIHVEQGLGDSIQFFRFLPLVKKLGGEVILECQPELLRWMKDHPGIDQLFPQGEKRPPYDLHAYLMSLPELLGTTLDTIPSAINPLTPTPSPRKAGKLQVGIVWAGNPEHSDDRLRSTRLEYFLNLATLPGVKLVSLQKGKAREALNSQTLITDDVANCFDFLDTAHLVQGLDLIITVDTSVAHLAATLQRPTWILLGYMPDWRWLLVRTDSPWYPSVRLYRQKMECHWEEQFARVKEDLRRFSENHHGS